MKKNEDNTVSIWLDLIKGTYENGDIVELPVISGSMAPVIFPGKKIKIMCLKNPVINAGDIIVFKDNKNLTSHRLLIKLSLFNRQFLYQKGDSNRFGSWINISQLVGVVVCAQNESGLYITQDSLLNKKEAKKQLVRVCWNLFLFIPRKIQNVFNKK